MHSPLKEAVTNQRRSSGEFTLDGSDLIFIRCEGNHAFRSSLIAFRRQIAGLVLVMSGAFERRFVFLSVRLGRMGQRLHPCISCGACCAHFRVQFYWREANPADSAHAVPAGLFEELTPMHRCMKGTEKKHHPKCAALKGRIGEKVGCTIYANRPSPCRAFTASFEDGKRHERCDEARRAHGLAPLGPKDFEPRDPEAEL